MTAFKPNGEFAIGGQVFPCSSLELVVASEETDEAAAVKLVMSSFSFEVELRPIDKRTFGILAGRYARRQHAHYAKKAGKPRSRRRKGRR